MPGTFTHFMIAEKAIDRLKQEPTGLPLGELLERRKCFVLQGSISPDYPFIAERLPKPLGAGGVWGNRMHSENTGAVVDAGLKILRQREGEARDTCQAWMFGYASHLIADTVVHPVVNLAVGGVAQFTETLHGECEIAQDTWVFRDVKGKEIPEGRDEYLQHLKACSDPKDDDCLNAHIHRFWRQSLMAAHPIPGDLEDDPDLEYGSIAPHAWHRALQPLFKIASKPGAALRYIGSIARLRHRLYDRWDKLPEEHRSRYVESLRVPNGTGGETAASTFAFVFEKAVSEVVTEWMKMAATVSAVLANPKADPEPFPNWDLDTGLVMPSWERNSRSGLDKLALWH